MGMFEKFPRISPFLWFDRNAEEAVEFYLTVFKNSRKLDEFRSPVETPGAPKGAVLTVSFELDGEKFTALNGGPGPTFNDAVSFVVRCENQEEIDDYYAKLLRDGGTEIACGWLQDKFGLHWQVVPSHIDELLRHPKAMEAMMQMKKLDMAALERAAQS
jgi:predicted 3-demethylubiquinone-9 3-methyltransferase (glyoxalase superfamily)